MEHKVIYNIILTPNISVFTFLNIDSLKKSLCYISDDEKYNMNLLPTIIDSCLLIGYDNKIHDDIILNFYYHHRDSSLRELFTFSNMIKKEDQPWRNQQIEYYMYKNVESIDLSEVAIIDRESHLDAKPDTLIEEGERRAYRLLDVLNQFHIDNNWGFKKRIVIPTKESMLINYIMRKTT